MQSIVVEPTDIIACFIMRKVLRHRKLLIIWQVRIGNWFRLLNTGHPSKYAHKRPNMKSLTIQSRQRRVKSYKNGVKVPTWRRMEVKLNIRLVLLTSISIRSLIIISCQWSVLRRSSRQRRNMEEPSRIKETYLLKKISREATVRAESWPWLELPRRLWTTMATIVCLYEVSRLKVLQTPT